MKNITKLFLVSIAIATTFSFSVNAQDLRYSQYNLSPVVLNPAQTGLFPGTHRLSLIYRSQWGNLSALFSTPAFSYDMPIKVGFSSKDAMGAGIYVINDNEGNGILSTQHVMLSGAYHKALDVDNRHNLSLGIQLGFVQKTIDASTLTFGSQWDGYGFTLPSGESFQSKVTYFNANIGLNYIFTVRQGLKFNAGLALNNVIQPVENFYVGVGDVNKRSIRPTYLLGATYDVTNKITLEPGLRLLRQSKSQDLFIGTNVGYKLNNALRTIVWGGLWYRNQESMVLSAGLSIKNIRVGFSYDVNVHGLKTGELNPKAAKTYEMGAIVILPIFQSVEDVIVPCLRF